MTVPLLATPEDGALGALGGKNGGTPLRCVVYVVGARANFVKMAPVIAALRRRLPGVVVRRGQHYDWLMSRVFVDELLTEPLVYEEFLSLQADAAAVLTDSGGIKEETTYQRVPCFTLRDTTEHPVTISSGTNVVLGSDPVAIRAIVPSLTAEQPERPPPPLWDGRAAERIATVVGAFLAAPEAPAVVRTPATPHAL